MLVLADFKDRLSETRGYKLNTKPREVDIRIIDRLGDTGDRMENAIAYLFERHNLVELKNPYEPLNLDVVWKGISYAAQYKSSGYDDTTGEKGTGIIPMEEVTLTFLRLSKPAALFEEMRRKGYGIGQKFPGVYYITGIADIKMQLVVGIELAGDEFVPLRVQKRNASEEDIRKFALLAEGFRKKGDKISQEMADAIMQVSISENKETYERLKEETNMCSALRELMNDQIEKEKSEAVNAAVSAAVSAAVNSNNENIARKMIEFGDPLDKISRMTSVTMERLDELAGMTAGAPAGG